MSRLHFASIASRTVYHGVAGERAAATSHETPAVAGDVSDMHPPDMWRLAEARPSFWGTQMQSLRSQEWHTWKRGVHRAIVWRTDAQSRGLQPPERSFQRPTLSMATRSHSSSSNGSPSRAHCVLLRHGGLPMSWVTPAAVIFEHWLRGNHRCRLLRSTGRPKRDSTGTKIEEVAHSSRLAGRITRDRPHPGGLGVGGGSPRPF